MPSGFLTGSYALAASAVAVADIVCKGTGPLLIWIELPARANERDLY